MYDPSWHQDYRYRTILLHPHLIEVLNQLSTITDKVKFSSKHLECDAQIITKQLRQTPLNVVIITGMQRNLVTANSILGILLVLIRTDVYTRQYVTNIKMNKYNLDI